MSDLNLIAMHEAGLSNRAIAKSMGLHHRTVSERLKKLGVFSTRGPKKLHSVGDDMAKCSKCEEVKPLTQFKVQKSGSKYPYRLSYCDRCRMDQVYAATRRDIYSFLRDRFFRLCRRCEKGGIELSITLDEIIQQYERQNGLCFYTDIRMSWSAKGGPDRESLSIDKIVPSDGYVLGNVVLCTYKANSVKNDLSLDEISAWLPGWSERISNFLEGYKTEIAA